MDRRTIRTSLGAWARGERPAHWIGAIAFGVAALALFAFGVHRLMSPVSRGVAGRVRLARPNGAAPRLATGTSPEPPRTWTQVCRQCHDQSLAPRAPALRRIGIRYIRGHGSPEAARSELERRVRAGSVGGRRGPVRCVPCIPVQTTGASDAEVAELVDYLMALE